MLPLLTALRPTLARCRVSSLARRCCIWISSNDSLAATTAFRNGTLQGAYLLIAARSLGLDVGAMSGFDNAKVDAAFFSDNGWRSNFLVNIGHGDPAGLFDRSPRLSFDEACLLA